MIKFILMHTFFFQAEDGIRDYKVTGVQTCALPICWREQMKLPKHFAEKVAHLCGFRVQIRDASMTAWVNFGAPDFLTEETYRVHPEDEEKFLPRWKERIAYALGAEIQATYHPEDNDWVTVTNPEFSEERFYKVKPEPKPD